MLSEDLALLQALKNGDAQALSLVFETHADRIYQLALGMLGDAAAADDVVQDTFLSLITHLDNFEGKSRLSTWLYRVAYNASIDRLRSRNHLPLPENDPDPNTGDSFMPQILIDWTYTPENLQANSEIRAWLDEAIGQLSESLRAVFILRDIDQLSTAETAEALNLTIEAVKGRLHRARLELRELLSQHYIE
jgi:RNA polymerase sigma-70 factor (ECF subfamily)